jgi:hypothetical protein
LQNDLIDDPIKFIIDVLVSGILTLAMMVLLMGIFTTIGLISKSGTHSLEIGEWIYLFIVIVGIGIVNKLYFCGARSRACKNDDIKTQELEDK